MNGAIVACLWAQRRPRRPGPARRRFKGRPPAASRWLTAADSLTGIASRWPLRAPDERERVLMTLSRPIPFRPRGDGWLSCVARRKDFLDKEAEARQNPSRMMYYRRNADYDRLVEVCSRKLRGNPNNLRALLIRASSYMKVRGRGGRGECTRLRLTLAGPAGPGAHSPRRTGSVTTNVHDTPPAARPRRRRCTRRLWKTTTRSFGWTRGTWTLTSTGDWPRRHGPAIPSPRRRVA